MRIFYQKSYIRNRIGIALLCLHKCITANKFCCFRVFANDENLRAEPKFVVFLSQLLQLFQVCATCKLPGVLVEVKEFGTMVQVETICNNESCPQRNNIWKSQPITPGTLTSAGNLLLSFAILVAGGTASKVIRIFKHMGLGCISLPTFFRHQRVS